MRKRSALVLLLSVSLAGCSSNIAGTASQVCQTWKIVTISKKDVLTPQTSSEIAGNNAARETWCQSKPRAS